MNSLTCLADCFFHENSVREKAWMCFFKEHHWLTQSLLCLLPQVWRTVTHKDPVASSGATNRIIQEPRGTPGGRGGKLCWTIGADTVWVIPPFWTGWTDSTRGLKLPKRLWGEATVSPPHAWTQSTQGLTLAEVNTHKATGANNIPPGMCIEPLFIFIFLFFNILLIQAAVPYSSGPWSGGWGPLPYRVSVRATRGEK